jgi:hypothetical protein
VSNLAGRQVFEFGVARELRRIKHQGHRVIKRKLKSADGPGAHAARLTHGANNLNTKRPAQFSHKVEQSNKRLKKRQEKVGPHHEHVKKARAVAAWRKKQATKKRRGLDAITRRAEEATKKANEAFASATESIELGVFGALKLPGMAKKGHLKGLGQRRKLLRSSKVGKMDEVRTPEKKNWNDATTFSQSGLHGPNPNKGTLTREQVRLRIKVPPRPQDKVQEIFISKLHAIRYKMPEAKNRGNLAKRKYLKAKK